MQLEYQHTSSNTSHDTNLPKLPKKAGYQLEYQHKYACFWATKIARNSNHKILEAAIKPTKKQQQKNPQNNSRNSPEIATKPTHKSKASERDRG